MKTYNQIFFKHFRGSFHVLTIVILSSLLIIFIQGCKKENNYVEKRNLQVELKLVEFKNALLEAKIDIEKMKKEELNTNKLSTGSSSISTFNYSNYFVQSVHYPAIELIRSYGITDEEIIAEFGSLDSSKIVLTAESILVSENLLDKGQTLSFFEPADLSYAALGLLGINSAHAETIGGCIADAIGITAAFEVVRSGVAGLGKRGVLKLLKKVAGKYLGPIGVALAAYDFAECMDWI
jgi:hypothetical protein